MNFTLITKFQQKLMHGLCNGKSPVIVVPNTKDSDSDDLKADLENRADEVCELVSYDLLRNVSAEFAGSVLDHFTATGRMTNVYEATTQGNLLFKKSSNRTVN